MGKTLGVSKDWWDKFLVGQRRDKIDRAGKLRVDAFGRDLYHFQDVPGGWRIGYSYSNYLIAEGPARSYHTGKALFNLLTKTQRDDRIKRPR